MALYMIEQSIPPVGLLKEESLTEMVASGEEHCFHKCTIYRMWETQEWIRTSKPHRERTESHRCEATEQTSEPPYSK